MPDPAERERAVAGLLDAWPWHLGGVVIGGYAVAAYGAPRYSDDVDIVVPISALAPLEDWLKGEGFESERAPDDLVQNYAGRLGRWRQGDITLDVIPGVVRDREARVDVPEKWVAKDPLRVRLLLMETSTRTEIPVARPEAFWVLKLQAGRLRDLADLFAVHEVTVDLEEVRGLFQSLWCESLGAKLQKVQEKLTQERLYADSLSRLARGSPHLAANRKAWEVFRKMVASAVPSQKKS